MENTENLKNSEYLNCGKRLFDLIFAFTVLIFISPILLLVALLIKITSKGPVIYKHKRLGKDGRTILVYKFRTMVKDADQVLKEILEKDPKKRAEFEKYYKLKDDPRVTKVGKILRKLSLDEIPQLFNVLKGEMSIVGPRPIIQEELKYYGDKAEKFLSVFPGVTGNWQVSGRNEIDYEKRVQLDMEYIEKVSFAFDLKIIFKTFKALFTGHGAY